MSIPGSSVDVVAAALAVIVVRAKGEAVRVAVDEPARCQFIGALPGWTPSAFALAEGVGSCVAGAGAGVAAIAGVTNPATATADRDAVAINLENKGESLQRTTDG
jgi:hypothetical protein